MFKCMICKKQQKANVHVIKVTLKKRERVYKNSYYNDDEKLVSTVSTGHEIIQEVDACRDCADKALLATTPA